MKKIKTSDKLSVKAIIKRYIIQIHISKKRKKTSSTHNNLHFIDCSKYKHLFDYKQSKMYTISLLLYFNKPTTNSSFYQFLKAKLILCASSLLNHKTFE